MDPLKRVLTREVKKRDKSPKRGKKTEQITREVKKITQEILKKNRTHHPRGIKRTNLEEMTVHEKDCVPSNVLQRCRVLTCKRGSCTHNTTTKGRNSAGPEIP